MRMWIEMPLGRSKRQAAASSSIWGCELKYSIKAEIRNQFRSSSIWGCELKFVVGTVGEKTLVILYMRMWIEIERCRGGAGGKRSSSIWGCELKYECWCEVQSLASHPLYEDVNWNPATSWVPLSLPCHPLYEDVNWNSNVSERDFRIICHPLYEDVNWNVNDIQVLREGFRHPLYEDVNWN